jgi:Zn-dependent protease with chaperone function
VIFFLRGLAVSLAFYLMLYLVVSVLVFAGWRLVRMSSKPFAAVHRANLLFVLRSLPVMVASLCTLAFVVPSFVDLEPRASAELVGKIPLALGGLSLFVLSAGTFTAITAYRKTSETVNGWLAGATIVSSRSSVPVFRILPATPALTLAGIRSHKMLLSEAAATLLTPAELDAALQHEVAHVRRRDNLKKLLFRFCAFPGMSRLEAAWREVEEMAADDAAVRSEQDALDLASALIKLSRLTLVQSAASLTTSLQGTAMSVNGRVQRLIRWSEERDSPAPSRAAWYLWGALLGLALTLLASYWTILRDMHAITEWMVR